MRSFCEFYVIATPLYILSVRYKPLYSTIILLFSTTLLLSYHYFHDSMSKAIFSV